MRPARAQPQHAPALVISNTMEQRYTEIPPARRGVPRIGRSTGIAAAARKFMRLGACSTTRAQCDWGVIYFQNDGGSATQKFLRPAWGAPALVRSKSGVQHEEGRSLEKYTCGRRVLSQHAPTAIGASFISNTMEQRYTELLWPGVRALLALVLSKSGVQTGRKGRSKIHAARRVLSPARAHCDWSVIYFKHDGGSATQKFSGPVWAFLALMRKSASNTRKEGRSKSCGPAFSSRTCPLRLGRHLFPNTMEAALHRNSSSPAGRSLRSCAVNQGPTRGRKGRSKIHSGPARAHSLASCAHWD
jgi:hypothetical protein